MNNSEKLFMAIEKHDEEGVANLLAKGLDVNIKNEGGFSALHIAIDETYDGGSLLIIRLLIEYGANVNVSEGDAPILLFAWSPTNKEVARILLEAGADPNVRTDTGDSPLRECVKEHDFEMVSLLLRSGADQSINEWGGMECGGMTALGIAVSQVDIPMIKLLRNFGAKLEAVDDGYKIARDYLPSQDEVEPIIWDEIMKLLS